MLGACSSYNDDEEGVGSTDGDALLDGNDTLAKTAKAYDDRLEAPYKGNERIVASFDRGKRVVAGGITEKNPYGYLRTITSYSVVDGILVLRTVNATLEDLIKDGDTRAPTAAERSLAAKNFAALQGGVSVLGGDLELDPGVLATVGLDEISVTKARVTMKPSVAVDASFRGGKLVSFELRASGKLQAEAALRVRGRGVTVGTESAFPMGTPVGPVAYIGVVPLFLQANVLAGCSAGAEAPFVFDAGMTASASVDLRVTYSRGKWTPVSSASASLKPTATLKPASGTGSFTSTAKAECHAGFSFDLLVAGVVGPTVKIYPSIEGKVTRSAGKTTAVLEAHHHADLGGKFEVLGRGVSATVPIFDKTVASVPWAL